MVAPVVAMAGAQAVGSIGGGLMERSSAKKADKAQQRAIRKATGIVNDYTDRAVGQYQQGYGFTDNALADALDQTQPWQDYGREGLNKLAYYMSTPERTQEMVTADPSYQFRLQQGQKVLENSAAARGMSLSGAQQKALTEYGQDFGSNEFAKAYQRLMDQSNTGLNVAQQAGQWGMNAGAQKTGIAQGIGNLYSNSGNALAGMILGGGNAAASSQVAQGNAMSGMFQGIGNAVGSYYGAKK